ncbi:nuclear factor erythroid 2-related factor 1, partial [Brachionus plicatilis]
KEALENEVELNKAHATLRYNASSSNSLSSVQSSALNGLNHNHTYLSTSNSEEDSLINHPYSYKNKLKKMLKNSSRSDGERNEKNASRDQQLLRENSIPLSLSQIVETSADEFNDLIRDKSLNNDQVIIAKDIRRRGKNKVAAQICRKRKLDSIDTLKESVTKLEQKKSILCVETANLQKEIREATAKFNKLYQDALGSSFNASDPTIVTINSLKEQLNTREVQTSEIRSYETEDSSPRDLDRSFDNDSDDEDEYDSDLFDEDEETQDTGFIKKMKKY